MNLFLKIFLFIVLPLFSLQAENISYDRGGRDLRNDPNNPNFNRNAYYRNDGYGVGGAYGTGGYVSPAYPSPYPYGAYPGYNPNYNPFPDQSRFDNNYERNRHPPP